MNATTRRIVIGTAAVSMALAMTACGKAGSSNSGGGDNKTIGLLLPENKTTRYETFDRPIIESKIKSLCSDCKVEYDNASQDTTTQKQQFDAMITKGIKVIILDPVDATATKSWVDEATQKGVKVVAYDRLAEGNVSAYISYDNEKIGELQGQALVSALGSNAAQDNIVMINGSPTDPNAALFKLGAHKVLDGKVKKIVYEQDITDWSPDGANQKMAAAITSLGKDGFQGVYSANDGMAGGIATALKSAGVTNLPLGGQDAELAGLQRIVAGQQTFTIYKGIRPEAEATAEVAVDLLQGKDIASVVPDKANSKSKQNIPTKLFSAQVVTKANIKDTVVKDGVYKVSQICTADFAAACKAAGLQ